MAADDEVKQVKRESASPMADHVDWATQEKDDADAIRKLFSNDPTNQPDISLEGPIDQSNKADDAFDFEDISDDDLPDEEEAANGGSEQPPALTSDGGTSNDNDDDLFGDGRESSPLVGEPALSPGAAIADADQQDIEMSGADDLADLRALNFDPEPSYPMANQDPSIPAAPESVLDLLKQTFPDFERGKILNFNELFPPRKANWVDKKPLRPPKPLVPNKLSLDIDVDQEKQFRVPGPASQTTLQMIQAAEKNGLVSLLVPEPVDPVDLEIFRADEPDSEMELVGGFTLRDIETVCEDWDDIIDPPQRLRQESPGPALAEEDDDWFLEMGIDRPAPKRRKVSHLVGLPEISRFIAPSFDNFEEATARSAKRVRLDMNDPYLLIDEVETERPAKRPKTNQKMKRMADGKMAQDITQRFNVSNDDAYEALKENVRDKVRATLGGIQVEHSIPARKLLWPYYQVKMPDPSAFSYHRPAFRVLKQINKSLGWAKPRWKNRRDVKGQRVTDLYKESREVSLNDNSTAVLFEYCEEIPTVLSNFGMGSKVVNYFRVNKSAEEKPAVKPPIGETKVLLPEDRSPFANFGDVNKGETVPTLQNQMYRAPIFQHQPRKTDFLIGRITNSKEGSQYYMRKINHLYVVGQNFPSIEVPGPHSRKVTNTSKNRLKMLSYRLINKKGFVALNDITTHVKDSNDAQNRQKLKEFLSFNKDARHWTLKEGEKQMDSETINSMVQPEDVCLMDAMQVGTYEVEKSGFAVDALNPDKEAGEGESLAVHLTPWNTSKAFIDATTGKAMLKLRGEGDPTGRGLGFSFIRTSMKGGFLNVYHEQGPQSTSADALERERKANGGHSYNVKKQNDAYAEVIADIWGKQKETLSEAAVHDDADVQPQDDEDDRFNAQSQVAAATPRFDEGFSQVSRSAISARNARRKLRIVRTVKLPDGTQEEQEEVIEDAGVIAQYTRARRELEEADIDVYNIQWTGNEERDRVIRSKLEQEELRLKKNRERRQQREKQKGGARASLSGPSGRLSVVGVGGGGFDGAGGSAGAGGVGGGSGPMSPEPSIEKGGTTRKCANCGQVGHIKTNKKLCPMLNGTMSNKVGGDDTTGTYGET
ncbi:histone acetyl transferase-2 [Diaporthe helianthi]|uniref:Histone acetyl transferase-2 n=1 Tax=Diaporthe helianthi TaxID=158607 RepID=A0A2P5IDN6_DIAHE|nr:histone acetyl transferase-2 [Diaporthe helianthi]